MPRTVRQIESLELKGVKGYHGYSGKIRWLVEQALNHHYKKERSQDE